MRNLQQDQNYLINCAERVLVEVVGKDDVYYVPVTKVAAKDLLGFAEDGQFEIRVLGLGDVAISRAS